MMASRSTAFDPQSLVGRSACSFQLQDFCIHIWAMSLASTEAILPRARLFLSSDERQRAEQIGSIAMQNAFVIARAALRSLLGFYLNRPPASIRIAYEAHGRPYLCEEPGIRFSATRSNDMVAFAFCLNTDLGIDIERFRIIPNMDRVVERMFSSGERRQLQLLPPDQRPRAFFSCWTRKEAYAKATGLGILTRFDNFCVDADPEEKNPKIQFGENPGADWTLHDLSLRDNYAAALAYRGDERAISIYDAGCVIEHLAADA